MDLNDFNYELPEHLIAQSPLSKRDDSRLLVYQNHRIFHSLISSLDLFVPDGSLFILNDSRVIPSRIRFKLPTGGKAEIFLLDEIESDHKSSTWNVLARPSQKLLKSTQIVISDRLSVQIASSIDINTANTPVFSACFSMNSQDLRLWLEDNADIPLPPYIHRDQNDSRSIDDRIRYQTVYSNAEGSVAAPTAGLHFTDSLMHQLQKKGCEFAYVTLHVGAGTFLPVKSDRIEDHVMHEERFCLPKITYNKIVDAKSRGLPVIAVGTTSLRVLEGANLISRQSHSSIESLTDRWLKTNIFIHPSRSMETYKPWCADVLMTNFHQPKSTLFMLIAALLGTDQCKDLYKSAIEKQYRFLSYGDSSLLFLKDLNQ